MSRAFFTHVLLILATVTGGSLFPTSCYAQAKTNVAKDVLDDHFKQQARDGEPFSYPRFLFRGHIGIGQIGYYDGQPSYSNENGTVFRVEYEPRVLQKLSDDAILLNVKVTVGTEGIRTGSTTVGPFHFSGFDFSDMYDDRPINFQGMLFVSGTFEYTNALGAKQTIQKIERAVGFRELPLNPVELGIGVEPWVSGGGAVIASGALDDYDAEGITIRSQSGELTKIAFAELAPKSLQRAEESIPVVREKAGRRLWQDKTGKFKLDAGFVRYADGKVTLRKRTGEPIDVPLPALCDNDRKWIRDRIKADRESGK